MTFDELQDWINQNFEIKVGEPKAWYERVVQDPTSKTPPTLTRFIYVVHSYGVRDLPRFDAQWRLADKMRSILISLRDSVPASSYGPTGKPILTVRRDLISTQEEYTDYDQRYSVSQYDVEDGHATIPNGWELDETMSSYRPVLKRGFWERMHFRFCVEGADPLLHQGSQGEGMPTPMLSFDDSEHEKRMSSIGYSTDTAGNSDYGKITFPDGRVYRTKGPLVMKKGDDVHQALERMILDGTAELVDNPPPSHGMTESKYAAIIAAQDAPKVEPSRYAQRKALEIKKSMAPVPGPKPAPKGILGWT